MKKYCSILDYFAVKWRKVEFNKGIYLIFGLFFDFVHGILVFLNIHQVLLEDA